MTRQLRKCFIVSTASVDTRPLREALARRGIESSQPDATATSLLLPDAIDQAISQSDFVCVVLTHDYDAPNVWFEAGLAQARDIPILVFAEPDVQSPIRTDQWNWVKAPLTNREAMELHLDAFLQKRRTAGSNKEVRRSRKGQTSRRNVEWARTELERLRNMQPMAPRAVALEQLLARLFQTSGHSVVMSPVRGKHQVDLGVWIDELQPRFLNPLFVEVKMGDISEHKLQQAENQLRSFIVASHGGLGLLVYLDAKGREFRKETQQSFPVIVWTSVPRLIEEVGKGGFVKLLESERNRAAHL